LKFPTRATREDFIYDGTFHEAVANVLVVAQLFGLMPVSGIKEKRPSKLKFKIFSFRFFLCILYIIGLLFCTSLTIHWIGVTRVELGKIINLTFECTNLLSLIFFLELARKWPKLMAHWHKMEKLLPQMKYQFDKQKMAYQIKMVSLVILFSSMSE
jgi:gustatory receptor